MRGNSNYARRLNIIVRSPIIGKGSNYSLERINFNALLFAAALFSVLSCIFNIVQEFDLSLVLFTILSSVILSTLYTLSRFRNYYNIWISSVTILVLLSISWFMNGGAIGSVSYIYLLALILLIVIAGRSQQNWLFALFLLDLAVLYLLEYFYADELVRRYSSRYVYYSDMIFVFTLVSFCTFYLMRFIKRSYDDERATVISQKAIIEEQNNEMLSSLVYASNLQKKIISHENQLTMLFSDYFVLFKPKDIVSGDFYWVKERGKYSIVVAADCTGHGVPAAFLGILGISLLEEILRQEGEELNAGALLEKLRNMFLGSLLRHSPHEDHPRDGIDMGICVINYQDYSFQFAGANRTLMMVRNNERVEPSGYSEKEQSDSHTLYSYKGTKNSVGFNYKEITFSSYNVEFLPKDTFYIFSDGYGDQFNSHNRKKFTIGRMKKEFLKIQNLTMHEQKEYLNAIHEKWKGAVGQTDDILILGLRM